MVYGSMYNPDLAKGSAAHVQNAYQTNNAINY